MAPYKENGPDGQRPRYKDPAAKHLRSQIVEMAVMTSEDEFKGQTQTTKGHDGIFHHESKNNLTKKTDPTAGLIEEKRRPLMYPFPQRKKEFINLHFTSLNKGKKNGHVKRDDSKSNERSKEMTTVDDADSKPIAARPFARQLSTDIFSEETRFQLDGAAGGRMTKQSDEPQKPRPPSMPKVSMGKPRSAHVRNLVSVGETPNQLADGRQTDADGGNIDSPNNKLQSLKPKTPHQSLKRENTEVKCEVTGNAVPAPAIHRNNKDRTRTNLFSASLAVFKSRIKASARKFSTRLNDETTREDEYIITVYNDGNLKYRSPDRTRHPVTLNSHDHPMKTNRARTCFPTGRGAMIGLDGRKLDLYPSIHNNQHETTQIEKYDEFDRESNASLSSSASNTLRNNNNVKCTYKLDPGVINQRKASEAKLQPTLPSVNKAKTYVLESESALLATTPKKASEPIPLTMHNLRLHESLMSMYARRAKRLERCRLMANGGKRFESQRVCDYAIPSERIGRWLDTVVTRFDEEINTLRQDGDDNIKYDSSSNKPKKEFQFIQPCSVESGYYQHHNPNKTIIFV